MKKNLFVFVLAAVMVLSLAGAAAAADKVTVTWLMQLTMISKLLLNPSRWMVLKPRFTKPFPMVPVRISSSTMHH